ncbi:MAG: TolC family protein [Muribaculaceae bacterium]|nr:TolC family protein [Muribaculaceae bacterium]
MALIAPSAMAATDTLRLSRRECVGIALQESPTIKVANLEIKRMDYSKKEVIANLIPSIDFQAAYQRAIELQTLNMSMGGMSQKIKMGTDNNWNLGFSAAMPIVNATLWKSISLSDTQILQARENARGSKIDMAENISKAYYALLLALDSRDVIRQNYDLAKFNAELYQKQFEAGTASEYDVLRSQVQVTNVEPELLQADISVKQCELQLKVLMGIDSEVVIEPTVRLKEMQQEVYGYDLGRDFSLADNTQLRSLDINRKLAAQNETLQKFAYIPSLAVQYNMNWNAMSNGNPFRRQEFNPYSNVALALQVPIFSGLGRYQKVRQAKVQRTELDLQRENLTNSLSMQVELALDNIKRQSTQISSSEKGMQMAGKALEIMQKSFEIGAASYLNLRDSEIANTSAQLAYFQSIYNYLVSTTDLDALLGREEALGLTKENAK